MPNGNIRLPCPVCRAVKLERLTIQGQPGLVLDSCGRCGGVWFDWGEVGRLRAASPTALATRVELRARAYSTACLQCRALFDRNQASCPVCGKPNRIECPRCGTGLERRLVQGIRIDGCRKCRGSWFDNVELAAIWNLAVDTAAKGKAVARAPVADYFLFDAVLWFGDPAVSLGAAGLAHGAAGLGHVGEAAAHAAEGAGTVASSVFEAIANLIGSVFDGG